MDRLVSASLALRRGARHGHGAALCLGLGACVVLGYGPGIPAGAGTPGMWTGVVIPLALSLLWTILLASRLRRKLTHAGEAPLNVDLEIGMLLAVGLDALLLRFDGGLSGTLSPAVYALVALVAAFSRPTAGLLVVLWVVVLEAAIRRYLLLETAPGPLLVHAGFVAAFALLNLSFLRAEVARIRITAKSRVEKELLRLKEDARRYRLLGAGEAQKQDERSEDRLARSSVEEIHEAVHYALDLMRRTLHLHTAVLLWLNEAGTHLRISELSTASDEVNDAPFPAGDGIIGAAVLQRQRVSLTNLKPSYKVPYYVGACPVRALTALPLLDGDTLRGLLVLDRVENIAFTAEEEDLAQKAGRHCLRSIHNERVFVQLERAKVEQGKLYRAAQALGSELSEKDVLEAGVRAAREIASFDLAAVTVYSEETQMHEVSSAKSEGGEIDDLVGARFAHDGSSAASPRRGHNATPGLVSMVVKNKCALPYKGEFDAARQVVLTRRLPWPKMPSLLVLPLIVRDRVLGTLILGAKRRHAFGEAVRPTLEVLASHLAVSLSNARMVHKLEQMATTDGLTGLFNKRAMLEAAAQKVQAAARFGRPLSVVICDIDLFKKVNDTHGHDVGDLVIKGLGEVLNRQRRSTDVVARFGGEEFVVLCEQTDEAGALLLAERIREDFEKTTFHIPGGTVKSTCSLGTATFPDAGRDWDSLFKAADEALYASKHGGRNRSTAASPRSEAGRDRAAASKRKTG
jgi:two-component system, cell cycle response regulator